MALIGHWRDNAGFQIAGTAFGAMNFAQEIRNDASGNYSKPNDSTIQFADPAGANDGYLIVVNIKMDDSSNNRINLQARAEITSGTGQLFTTYMSGYSRNSANRVLWVRVFAFLRNNSANAQVQIQMRRDTNAPTGGSIVSASDLQVVKFSYSNIGIYSGSTGTPAYGGTALNQVDIGATVFESDTAAIERTGNIVSIKDLSKRYLVLYTVGGAVGGGSRTQRITSLLNGGLEYAASRSYAYQRNAANQYAGMGGMALFLGVASNVEMGCFRGPGVGNGEGGADVDGSWTATLAERGMCVIELNDSAEVFAGFDPTGGQAINGGITQTINASNFALFNDATSFVRNSASAVEVIQNMDALVYGSIFAANNNVGSGTRLTAGARIEIDGADQTVGEHGNYMRGNQGTQNTFGYSAHPGGLFSLTDGQLVEMETFDGGDNGTTSNTVAQAVALLMINLDTLKPTGTEVEATASGDLEFNGAASEAAEASATAPGALSFSGLSSIASDNAATATGSIDFNGAAQQTAEVRISSQAGTLDFTATATGVAQIVVSASADATLNFTATGDIKSEVSGTVQGNIDFTATATGIAQVEAEATATGSIEFTAQVEETATNEATASGSLEFTGIASGETQQTVSSTASGSLTLAAVTSEAMKIGSTAQGSIDFSGTVLPALDVRIEASPGTIEFNSTNEVTAEISDIAVGSINFSATADRSSEVRSSADATLEFTSIAEIRSEIARSGTGTIEFTATAEKTNVLLSFEEIRDLGYFSVLKKEEGSAISKPDLSSKLMKDQQSIIK